MGGSDFVLVCNKKFKIIFRIGMLLRYLPVLNQKKVILGSQSKTRRELMEAQVLTW